MQTYQIWFTPDRRTYDTPRRARRIPAYGRPLGSDPQVPSEDVARIPACLHTNAFRTGIAETPTQFEADAMRLRDREAQRISVTGDVASIHRSYDDEHLANTHQSPRTPHHSHPRICSRHLSRSGQRRLYRVHCDELSDPSTGFT